MGDKSYSHKILNMEQEIDTESIDNRPLPVDFDVFMPWACKEYCIDADVIVSTAVEEVDFGVAATNKKYSRKGKLSTPATITQDPTSYDENQSSENEKIGPSAHEKIVKIETVYGNNDKLVQVKFLKNKLIPRKVIQVLALTIPFQQHLTAITINSGLRMDSLYELSKCLPNSHVTELCLDGTSVKQGNYHILLTHGKLKHLSLARCSLNDAVIEKIAEQLKDPENCLAAKVLSALNLSTNRITDIGAKHLARMLRTNRQLSYLNLAGNMITDEGGVSILNTLQKFPLETQEFLDSRARQITFLVKKSELIKSFIMELQTTTIGKSYKRKTPKKAKLESTSMQENLPAMAQSMRAKAELMAANKLDGSEPFSLSNTETRDGVMHCLGNNTLCYLNIAYNHLTYISVKKLVEVLTVQKSLNRTPRGLIKVLIAGNLMPDACTEFKEIDNLLEAGVRHVKIQTEPRKKPMSAKSTVR